MPRRPAPAWLFTSEEVLVDIVSIVDNIDPENEMRSRFRHALRELGAELYLTMSLDEVEECLRHLYEVAAENWGHTVHR